MDDLAAFLNARYGEAERDARAVLDAEPVSHASYPAGGLTWCGSRHEGGGGVAYPCATVRQLGTEFSGHPAYKAEWAP